MARAKSKLTQARLKMAATGTIEWDGELRGFGCRITAGLLDRDIQSLEPIELREPHRDLTEKGRYAANNGLRAVRAVLNTAAKLHPHLRRDPTSGVTYHKQRRRQEPIEDLAA